MRPWQAFRCLHVEFGCSLGGKEGLSGALFTENRQVGMSVHDGPVTSPRRPLKAVCFDFRGVILDHKTNEHMVPGMERLLSTLKRNGITLALISRFPKEVLTEMLGPVQKFFGRHVYSSSEHGKLACIKEFAREC